MKGRGWGKASRENKMPDCPFFSIPDHVNQKGVLTKGKTISCKGLDCKLYRAGDEPCAFLNMPKLVDDINDLRDQATAAVQDASKQAQGSVRKANRSVEKLKEDLGGIIGKFNDTHGGLEQEASQTGRTIEALLGTCRETHSRQAELLATMESTLRRLDREHLLARADAAAGEAAAQIRRGDPSGALPLLLDALRITGGSPSLFNALGGVYLHLDQPAQACSRFRSSIELDPDFAAAHLNLGAALLLLGETGEAEQTLRTGLHLDPGSGYGWNTLGNLEFHRGRRREAVAHWERAVDLDPGLAPAWENLRRQQQLENCPFPELIAEAQREDRAARARTASSKQTAPTG